MNINFKLIFISFILMLSFQILNKTGIFENILISPVGENITTFDMIKPKLSLKPNSFNLHKSLEITTKALASSNHDYDNSEAYVVVDFNNGKIIKSKNLNKKLPIASLTKILTAVTALDLLPPSQELIVDHNSANQIPTRLVLTPGEKITLEEALNAAILTSANDMTQLINNGINKFYNDEIFIKALNEKSKLIGLKNSSFSNPQGFDSPNNFSTVEDLAILANYALKNYPIIADISAKDKEILPQSNLHKEFYLNNWQGLIGVYPGITGLKIGNTAKAGHTTIVVAQRENHTLIAVLLGAPGVMERDLWTSKLLDDSFYEEYNLKPINITESDLNIKYSKWKYFK